MSDAIKTTLATQLQSLSEAIRQANTPGDVQGLQARFFLQGAQPKPEVVSQVDCANDRWISENEQNLGRGGFAKLAALGYSLFFASGSTRSTYSRVFLDGMHRLKRRQLFPADQVAFPNIPSAFLGIALGVVSMDENEDRTALMNWLSEVLQETTNRDNRTGSPRLIYLYIGTLLHKTTVSVSVPGARSSLVEIALVDWGQRLGAFHLQGRESETQVLQERILGLACSTNLDELPAGEAAVVLNAVASSITSSVHERVLAPSHVLSLLNRFESSLRRWRWDREGTQATIRWPITREREVQDIVWLILRSVFDDLVDEETLPKVGHSSYKPDFGTPSIGTLVEVKFARGSGDFRRIEKEVMEDSVAYLQETKTYRRLVVFIYDDSASVQEHEVTSRALERLPNVEGVVIASRPSQLPFANEQGE